MWSLRERPWSFGSADQNGLEQVVGDWLTQQEAADWLPTLLVLSTLLAAIVFFAISRAA